MKELIIFEDNELKLEVNFDSENETVWLTQKQMGELFDRDRKTITRHIVNIFKEMELAEELVCLFFEHTAFDGKKYNVKYYNLDMIISVGYRVKSKRGIIFRKWATSVLRDYMIRGYAENKRMLEKLEKTLSLVDIASRIDGELSSTESKQILSIINRYGKTIKLLDDYDHKNLSKINVTKEEYRINYDECIDIISDMRMDVDSKLFGLERENNFVSCIETIYQTYGGNNLYNSIEERASNLLYLIVKNHTFIDGNKRIGALIFLYYLGKNNFLYKDNKKIIDDNMLVALTILIAQSNPREKDILVDLVINFLVR